MMKLNPKMKIRDVAGEHIVMRVGANGTDMTTVIALNESSLLLCNKLMGRAFGVDDAVQVLTDEYELGNTPLSAVPLWTIAGTKTISAAIQTGDDVDYYSFVLERRGTTADSVTLTFDTEFGDLDLYLYDVNGIALLRKSISVDSGSETISLSGLKRGVYIAKVANKDGQTVANYDLAFNIRDDAVRPDGYENNNSMKDATKLFTLNGDGSLEGLSIHLREKVIGVEADVDYYKFTILEKGSADDSITLSYVVDFGDLDMEILNARGEVVAWSRTAGNEDTVSLKGFEAGEYYIHVYGYNNIANNYSLSWHVTNSSLIPSDSYEGMEPIAIRESQTITGLTLAKVREEDETRADTFKIVLDYDAWKRSKIILTDYRSDWEDGLAYVLKDAQGNVLMEGVDSEISLYGLTKGEYYLTLDAPRDDEYSEYSLIAQNLPDSDNAKDNTWSVFIYMAGDNNLEGAFLEELLYMQKAILPEDVEVYVLLDRAEGYSAADGDWTDTRVGKIRHSDGGEVAVEWMYFDGANTKTYASDDNLELKQEWDTGNVKTLEAFLDWGMQAGRAENYALIMKDHGTSLGYNSRDEKSGTIMSIQDVAELLKDEKYQDLSVVAFDECLMGSDVVVTTMGGTVDYVVASEAVGYTPNWLVMYKVLLNSFETEMTPQDVAQKIVAACNCSGLKDLTMASFKSDDNTLSTALNQFGELSKQFTYADWVALCKCYSSVHNYGDEICAYSDLGSILNMIKGYSGTISSTLLDATNALYDIVLNTVIDSTMITPDVYGTGLAVFNPVCSSPVLTACTYGGGSSLDYYATEIGKSSWGKFLYTLSKVANDCSSYIVDASGNLTFTSFTYYYDDGELRTAYDLGAFSGNGVTFEGLYLDDAAFFNLTLDHDGLDGDAIVISAKNPNAKLTVYLMQTIIPTDEELAAGAKLYQKPLFVGENALSLADIKIDKDRAMNDYTLVVRSSEETTFDLKFVADWTTGVDFFDYSRTGSIDSLAAGNNSIDKATQLPNGNYGGLVTCAGDRDYYQILSVYANTVDVTVKGSNLVVKEFNAAGELLQTAVKENGLYKLAVAKDNCVCVEGTSEISAGECDSYTLTISDAAEMYLKPEELNAVLPEMPVVTSKLEDNRVVISVAVGDGLQAFYSKDLYNWDECDDSVVADENERYYFKAVDAAAGLESQYASLRVAGIDHELPVVGEIVASTELPTDQDVILTAEFTDNVAVNKAFYRIGEDGEWLDYVDGVTVSENAIVYFKAIDLAGNESEVVEYEVKNINKVPFSDVAPLTRTWEEVEDAAQYIVEYSADDFEHVIRLAVDSNSLDSFRLPAGDYQMRVKPLGGDEWTALEPVAVPEEADDDPKLVRSNADGNADVFFAAAAGKWETGYVAQNVGSINDWAGTDEFAAVFGKNMLSDIIEGSTDANVLLMTDDANGDALFVDDIYSALPGSVPEQQSRIAGIDEIRAGAGNDVVDMTSQRFEYIGDGLTIRGGDGNDTIWANKGDNWLFGDAGKDRIVGASGNDVIAGGIGNDRMHGGGGNDVFAFCEDWGTDTVEQLATGTVTLWFASGDESKWHAESLTYTDGANSVTVKGVTAEQVTLKFGDDGSAQFASLASAGSFDAFTSRKIFEESDNGLLASV